MINANIKTGRRNSPLIKTENGVYGNTMRIKSGIFKIVTADNFSTVIGIRGNLIKEMEINPTKVIRSEVPTIIINVQTIDFNKIFDSARWKADVMTEKKINGIKI